MINLPDSERQPASETSHKLSLRQVLSSGILLLVTLLCVVAAALGVSAAGGYAAGQKQRNISATQTTVVNIDLQFGLGISDLQNGRYQLAAQRFRWVLDRSPNYPGAADRLAEAEQHLAQSAGSNATGQGTLVPSTSQDPASLFEEGKKFFDQEDWPNTINRLDQVQSLDQTYRNAEVQEMLYKAYASLGLIYVRGDRIEEGLFMLDQAAKIRDLDDQTEGERYLARLYSTGQSYWGLNWNIVIQNFAAIYETAPNYHDVAERLWDAYVKFGDQLLLSGAGCDAVVQYDSALLLKDDSDVQAKKQSAQEACANPTAVMATSITPDDSMTPSEGNSSGLGGSGTSTPTPSYNIPNP
jgi:tetratricopeptide (TPR) repeat protein